MSARLRSNDLGATWNRATFAELEPALHGTHEGKVLCTAENACVYLGLQDPKGGLRAAGTTYNVWNGQWCAAVNLPGQVGYLGQRALPGAAGSSRSAR